MKARGIFAITAALVIGLVQRGAKLVRDIRRDASYDRHPRATHGRGKSKCQSFIGKPGSKLWHRLAVGHSAAAGWTDRRTRRYALRGYGYIAPPPKAGEVEYVGTKRKTMRRAV